MAGKGEIDVTILDDGTVKSETGDMSGALHQTADNFLKELARLMGGAVAETKAKHAHTHSHTHSHDHERH